MLKLNLAVTVATAADEITKAEECEVIIHNNQKGIFLPMNNAEMTEEKIKNKETAFLISNYFPPHLPEKKEEEEGIDYIYMQDGDKKIKIVFTDILYIQAAGRYATIFKTDGTIDITEIRLDEFEMELPGNLFFRIHRSQVINASRLDKITKGKRTSTALLNDATPLGIAARKLPSFFEWLKKNFPSFKF